MQIGSNENFLSVERVGQGGPTVVWRIQAAMAGVGCLTAVQRRAKVAASERALRRVKDFAACRIQRFKVLLSRGDWLRVKRARGGHALVRYRLGQANCGISVEGRVRLDGKSVAAFCRNLRALL